MKNSIFIFAAFLIFPAVSLAIDFTPLTITSVSDNVDLDFPSSPTYGGIVYTPNTVDGQAYSVYPIKIYSGTGGIDSMTWETFINDAAADQFEGTYRIIYGNLIGVCETLTYDDCLAYPLTDGQFLVLYDEIPDPPTPEPATNSVWGTDNAFFGSSSPISVLASVSGGVTDTGVSLWPLLLFLGIGIAFIIGNMLMGFIRQSTQTKTVKKKEDFIYHSADDLEFKRNYGQGKASKQD